jgi:hypothetical protein
MQRVFGTFYHVPFLIAGVFAFSNDGEAHNWYDDDCCRDQDCALISGDVVVETKGGFLVTIKPGEHPNAHQFITGFIPYGSRNLRSSRDNGYHACVVVNGEMGDSPGEIIRCLYIPSLS